MTKARILLPWTRCRRKPLLNSLVAYDSTVSLWASKGFCYETRTARLDALWKAADVQVPEVPSCGRVFERLAGRYEPTSTILWILLCRRPKEIQTLMDYAGRRPKEGIKDMNGFLLLCLSLLGELAFLPPPTTEVQALVRQLGDLRYAVRKESYQTLEKMGAHAILALKKAQHDPDAEISLRANKLVRAYYEIGMIPSIYQLLPPELALQHYQRVWADTVQWDEPWYHELCYDHEISEQAAKKYCDDVLRVFRPAFVRRMVADAHKKEIVYPQAPENEAHDSADRYAYQMLKR